MVVNCSRFTSELCTDLNLTSSSFICQPQNYYHSKFKSYQSYQTQFVIPHSDCAKRHNVICAYFEIFRVEMPRFCPLKILTAVSLLNFSFEKKQARPMKTLPNVRIPHLFPVIEVLLSRVCYSAMSMSSSISVAK